MTDTVSAPFPRLSHRAVKKICSFQLLSRLSPSLNSSPEVVPSARLGSLTTARGIPLRFPVAGRSGRRCEGLCNVGACSGPGTSPGARAMCQSSTCAPQALPAAGLATSTLYPQNRCPPARLFPWKRQSDSGLWDQLENTTMSSERPRGARVSVPEDGRMSVGTGQGCLPARAGARLCGRREVHRHTPRKARPTPAAVSQKSSLLTQVRLQHLEGIAAARSPGDTSQNVPRRRQLLIPLPQDREPRMHSHPQSWSHQLQQPLSPAPLSPAGQAMPLGAVPRAKQLAGGLVWERGAAASTPQCLPARPAGLPPPCSPSLAAQAWK